LYQQKSNSFLRIIIVPSLLAFLASCFHSKPEEPGQLANPKLAHFLNEALQKELQSMSPKTYPGLIPDASKNSQLWLTEIQEVVARCRYGPRSSSKFNLLEYDITLRNGQSINSVYTGQRCVYSIELPLVMRIQFENGQITQAFSDGRELKRSVDTIKGDVLLFAEKIIRADLTRNRSRYFPVGKTEAQIRDEWRLDKP
jgi:hypothetical protein